MLSVASLSATPAALAAEAPYPFEGTWVRAERTCSPAAVRSRTYTAKEVVSPRGRCTIHRIAGGSGVYELLEDCRRTDRPATVTETIRMIGPDGMALKRQVSRLKIPRQIRYTRCAVAAQAPSPAASHPAKPGTPEPRARDRDHDND